MGPEEIAARLAYERRRRGWDVPDMARRLREASGGTTQHDSLRRQIHDWERTGRLSERTRLLYAKAFGVNLSDLFRDPREQVDDEDDEQVDETAQLLEVTRMAEASDLGAGTLEDLTFVVDRLCRDYPTVPALTLRDRVKGQLRQALRLLNGRTTLDQHRELLVHAGWLACLLGCVYYDLGDRAAAEMARRAAARLGGQAGHGEIVGWSWEMAAWFNLVEHRYADVVAASEAGLEGAGVTNAGVQLTLQAAKGYAKMGDRRAGNALRQGQKLLAQRPAAEHPEHHFVFDASKFEFYAATIYTWLGEDDAAEEHAREVVRQCETSSGIRWPMRLADVRIDLALIAGRRGDLDEAVTLGKAAWEFPRRSASLLSRSEDLHQHLATRYPDERLVAEYGELLQAERAALPPADEDIPLS